MRNEDGSRQQPTPAATATLGALAGVTAAALVLALFWLIAPLPVGIPTGAIVASTEPCDTQRGWSAYEDGMGRILIGADPPNFPAARGHNTDEEGKPLTARTFGKAGGKERLKLRAEQIPPLVVEVSDGERQIIGLGIESRNADNKQTGILQEVSKGGAAPHLDLRTAGPGDVIEFLPPYMPVYFCLQR